MKWSSRRSSILLVVLTLACLLPFSSKAFNVDDPLFLWSAQQIEKHPLDPYGFRVVWETSLAPMPEITKNPPLACYYAAAVGSLAGWSEIALHLGFLLPALAVVLGTYRLAQRFTRSPLVAAMATLLTPGVMVSATSVMCDTLMLAFWLWAMVLWLEGFESNNPRRLLGSALLMTAAELTKYFGACVIPLLLAYSIFRRRRIERWAWYFAVPAIALVAYQLWMNSLYGHGMVFDAFGFATQTRWTVGAASVFANALVGASFAGGCAICSLALAPLVWSWKRISIGLLAGAITGPAIALGWIGLGTKAMDQLVENTLRTQSLSAGAQLALLIAGGVSVLSLAAADVSEHRDSDSSLLAAWVFGTFVFTAFINWTANARSVLPLIPAVGILLARRLEGRATGSRVRAGLAIALVASGIVSLWVAVADAEWANSQRTAVAKIVQRLKNETGHVWFQGHWGFQYYAQQAGLQAFDYGTTTLNPDDEVIIPLSYHLTAPPPEEFLRSAQHLEIALHQPLATMRWQLGTGFYSSFFGPMPFAFGVADAERYYVFRMKATMQPDQWPRPTRVPR